VTIIVLREDRTMKRLIIYAILLASAKVEADELVFGLVTAHLYNVPGVSQKYSGCLHKSCEVIYNPLLAYRATKNKYHYGLNKSRTKWIKTKDSYIANTFVGGLNSVHQPMAGYYFSFGVWAGRHKVGFAAGAYLQDNSKFYDRYIQPFSVYETQNIGVVPIIGVEHQFFFDKHIFTSAIITPAVANFGFGYSF
jgi:hypothetical protein